MSENVKLCQYEFNSKQKRYLRVKYTLDFFAALILMVLLIIPFLIISLIQKIVAPNEPVFFVQERIGQGGKPFHIIKFRTMKSSADHYIPTNRAMHYTGDMTKFGKFLRDTSIDELPQLLHVLSGKMSLIGPRPLIPQEDNVHRMRREAGVYQLRPGITGWAQVNGRDYVNDDDKVMFDREYLQRLGFPIDAEIFARTVKLVFRRENIL